MSTRASANMGVSDENKKKRKKKIRTGRAILIVSKVLVLSFPLFWFYRGRWGSAL